MRPSVLEKGLTPPTLLETRFVVNLTPGGCNPKLKRCLLSDPRLLCPRISGAFGSILNGQYGRFWDPQRGSSFRTRLLLESENRMLPAESTTSPAGPDSSA
jgi:hypothetical protein